MRTFHVETHHAYNIPIFKVLLLEGINPVAVNAFENAGYEVCQIESTCDHHNIMIALGHKDLECIR